LDLLRPYPGLRPFEPDEALKFYGRETHTAELLRRLAENRFIAVVGNSGSGKSSLVRAGLLPALHRGRLTGATSQWRIAILRPGDAPMTSLGQALADKNVFSAEPAVVLEEIKRSSLGLVRAVRTSRFGPGESLLLVVDQFEELFRFARARKQDGGAEARLFVASLLEAADLSSAPVYVVLTMRSDFLGDCSQFPGLPEALNRSQYLIPRMTREQVRAAIEKPVRLVGARMSARLVELLLNELGDETGQLPALQHALNRTFHEWKQRGGEGEIAVEDYAAAGEMKGALNAHAEALLDPSMASWTEKVFRCLTTTEGDRRARQPTRLDDLYNIVGACSEESKTKVLRVVRAYGDPEHAMLVWSGKELTVSSVIDISHESLIEHWDRLKGWVKADAEAANLYYAAALDTAANRRGAAARWRGLKLSEALGFLEKGPWNKPWAERLPDCAAPFDDVQAFVETEEAAQRIEEAQKEGARRRELERERKAKQDAEARAAAEAQAREAADAKAAAEASLAQAERKRKRWILASGAVLTVVLLAFLGFVVYERAQIKAQRDILNLYQLRQEVAASDDLVVESARKINDVRRELAQTKDTGKRESLQKRLTELEQQASQATKQRDSAAKQLNAGTKAETRLNPADGLTYVHIPAGSFAMGCSPGDAYCQINEWKPPHTVVISNDFWLGQTEVTQAAWTKIMGGNPSYFKSDQLPVETVSWNEAKNYCGMVNGRLPTEQEWEYAARAGTTGPRYGSPDAVAWYGQNSNGTTHPVGLKQPNPFGLYDLLGNVWEWTSTDYDTQTKVVRGGAWDSFPWGPRASTRSMADRRGSEALGFRCVGEFR
jgi:formylglycine-generating enzyme required for sulfatase activity